MMGKHGRLDCMPTFEILHAKAATVVQPWPRGRTKYVRMGNQDEGADVTVPGDGQLGIRLLLVPLQRRGTASRCRTIALCVTETRTTPGEKPRHKRWHKMQKYETAVHGWAVGRWDKPHPDSVRPDRSGLSPSTFSTIVQLQEALMTSSVKK